MSGILTETLGILNESAPYLLLGFGLAGLLHVILERYPMITRLVTGPGGRPVVLAAAVGLPMPLCSCGVLPAALALRKEGASKGATSSFLISVPETDIVSIALTYALLGPVLAIYRPVAALVTAVGTGFFVNAVDRQPASPGPQAPNCDDHCQEAPVTRRHWLVRALNFGFVEMFDDIVGRLLLGMAIAGVLMWFLPGTGLDVAGGSALTYLLMLVIGVPVYVCATASTPVAVGLIAGGVSPGAAMVFLLAGPATNIAGLFVLARHFGRRALAAYLVGIAVFTVLLGVGLDRLLASGFSSLIPATTIATHSHSLSIVKPVASGILLLLAIASFYRTRPWTRVGNHLRARWLGWKSSGLTEEACNCGAHTVEHEHGPGCGHPMVEHEGHVDYVVDGHLHHPKGSRCVYHGPLEGAGT